MDSVPPIATLFPRAAPPLAGRFEVGRLVGRGGMGTVHRGTDVETGLPVAIKFLSADDADQATRFEREATALALLDHPNIVRHIAHGRAPDGLRFLVMEWLEGQTLDERLDGGPIGLRGALRVALQLAHALAAVHAQGLVHRDLKAANVLLVDPRLLEVRLIDFGIARRAGEQRLTQDGVVMGTPGCIAPEQIRGAPHVDGRADLYALGGLLFRGIAGRMPYVNDSTTALLMRAMLERAPALSSLVPSVPPDVDRLVASLLEIEPARRPEGARAVGLQLEALLARADVAPQEPSTTGSLGGGERRLRTRLTVRLPYLAESPSASHELVPGRDTQPTSATGAGAASGPGDPGAPGALAELETGETAALEAPGLPLLTAGTERAPVRDAGAREAALAACALRFGADVEAGTGPLRVVSLAGHGTPADEVRRAVRCAAALQDLMGPIGMALTVSLGLSDGVMSTQSRLPAPSPTGTETRPSRALPLMLPGRLRLDETAAGLLDGRYAIEKDADGPFLVALAPLPVPERRILGRRLPFVGRERELALVRSFFEAAVDESTPGAVVVTGPPGQGKSGLLRAFLQRISAQHDAPAVFEAQADQLDAGAPFSLYARLLLSARRVLQVSLGMETSALALPGAAEAGAGAPADSASLASTLREGCEALLVELLRRLPPDRPVVIALDDLHWADGPSVRTMDILLRLLTGRPVLVLALARPEVDEAFPRLWSGRSPHRIALGDLSARAAASLVRAALGDTTPESVVSALVARAAGNAFFLEELIRATADGRGEHIPETVLATVQARLLTLEPEARRILRLASLLGERFRSDALRELALEGEPGADPEVWLHVLVEREFLRTEATGARGTLAWRFAHALVRDAAYEMFTDDDRAVAHRLLAAQLARGQRPDPLRIAHHLIRGQQGPDAARWLAQGAAEALRASDPAAARGHAERGLSVADDTVSDELRGTLLAASGEAARLLGDAAGARDRFGRALAILPPGTAAWYQAQRNAVLMGMTVMYAPKR